VRPVLILLIFDVFLVALVALALWAAYQIFGSDGGPNRSTVEVSMALLIGFVIGASAGVTYVHLRRELI
jgi:hypothetical protein